jgi:hypothetical protein
VRYPRLPLAKRCLSPFSLLKQKQSWFPWFGDTAEVTPPPPPAPVSSAEERQLDARWARHSALTRHPADGPLRREDCPGVTELWTEKLRGNCRFLLVVFPVSFERSGSGFIHSYSKVMRYPLRRVVQSEGGFDAYCHGPVFAASVCDDVTKWQSAAREWNRTDGRYYLSHDLATIDNPELKVHLLDPEEAEPLLVKVRIFSLPPPAPVPVPPIAAQPHGIGHVLQPIKKKKKKPLTL